jgi:hypothetical protein
MLKAMEGKKTLPHVCVIPGYLLCTPVYQVAEKLVLMISQETAR